MQVPYCLLLGFNYKVEKESETEDSVMHIRITFMPEKVSVLYINGQKPGHLLLYMQH